MRKIILFIATSLDGYIARQDGDVNWLFTDQDYGYNAFYNNVDTIIMGRKTYEQVLLFGEFPYRDKVCYVFSENLHGRNEHVSFISEDVGSFSEKIKNIPGQNIWLVGGANLIHNFVTKNLVDEYIISIHPMLLGDGITLFEKNENEVNLNLVNTIKFDSGLIQLHYERVLQKY